LGIALWCQDEAGPYQAIPHPGQRFAKQGKPECYPHTYVRGGTAKMLTLFHPASGKVRVKGVLHSTNAILHPWIKEQITEILAALPTVTVLPTSALPPEAVLALSEEENRACWKGWQESLTVKFTLLDNLPPLRLLLIWDNLTGHWNTDLLIWLMRQGVMVLFTPLSGSWLNLCESVQRIIVRRALSGQSFETPEQVMTSLESVARGWNRDPTPFVWGGRRKARRERARDRHRLGGSGGFTRRPVRRRWAGNYA
jgi:hypothetical protein